MSMDRFDLSTYRSLVNNIDTVRSTGKVTRVIGLTIEASGIGASIGDICYIMVNGGKDFIVSEVVGFRDSRTVIMPLGEIEGIAPGCTVIPTNRAHQVPVGEELLGTILDGLGRPMEDSVCPAPERLFPVHNNPPNPLERQRIEQVLATGIKAIDIFLTLGRGQRMGIFSGSGVGKSTLLGMIARYCRADVNVIGLIGERGREVKDFLEKDLGEEGLKRSVVIVVTSDQPPLIRIKGAFITTAIAEFFRDQGLDVMLMMDSITRFALAQREVGLAVGEPPTTRGYTPSVFAVLPKLLERAGRSANGSITGLYTVLVEADDLNEPISDAVRGILDGHIVLSRTLAAQNHFPAVDVLQSISRLMYDIVPGSQQDRVREAREHLATYEEARDLINIGAYKAGSDPKIDASLERYPKLMEFIKQDVNEYVGFEEAFQEFENILR